MKNIVSSIMFMLAAVLTLAYCSSQSTDKVRLVSVLKGKNYSSFISIEPEEAVVGEQTPLIEMFEGEVPDYVPSNLSPGEPGFGLDIMTMMKNTNPTTPAAKLKKETIELYYKASTGEVSDAALHLPPDVYAAIHMNESSGATFLDGHYEDESSSYSPSDMTLAKFTGSMLDNVGFSPPATLAKDNGNDGYPDGPFQIERGAPNDSNNSRKSKMSGHGQSSSRTFDVVYFPDSLSWVEYDFSAIAQAMNAPTDNKKEVAMLASCKHNRGSVSTQSFGLPYTPSGSVKFSSYVNANNEQIYKETRRMFADMISAYDSTKPQIFGYDAPSQRALGILLLLKSGWYVETMDGISSTIDGTVGKKFFNAIFPEASGQKPSDYVAANFNKKPWDVVGISKSDYGRIYGMAKDSYKSYYNFSALFKVENYTSDLYVNKMPNGSAPPVVHAWDYVVVGHCAGSAFAGETILLEMFVAAGMPKDLDGSTIDPSNPSTAYKEYGESNANSYNPSGPGADVSQNFNKLLSMLNISTTPGRIKSLYHTYEFAGNQYMYGGGGKKIGSAAYPDHKYWAQDAGKVKALNHHYSTKSGAAYVHGETKDSDLVFQGDRVFDCATLAMCGPSLGKFSSNGTQMLYSWNTKGIRTYGIKPRGSRMVTGDDGKSYDTGFYEVSGPHTMAKYETDKTLSNGGLLPGDILTSAGHAFTVLCVSTVKTTIPAEITRGLAADCKVGSLMTVEAWASGSINSVRNRGWHGSGYYLIRSYMMDN